MQIKNAFSGRCSDYDRTCHRRSLSFWRTGGASVYLDISLQRFHTVFPACGSSNSAIELDCDTLFRYANAIDWVDVCKGWQENKESIDEAD